jgi:hypothetical protein
MQSEIERLRKNLESAKSSPENDEQQMHQALMPLLASLVDPSDQIIVQDKQGRTFKIAFCEY